MLTPAIIGTFILTCLVIELTPGPNMGYLALLSAREGRRAGFAAAVGVALGLSLIGFAAAAGIALVVASFPPLYEALRWAGVAYMMWLAWDAWAGREQAAGNEAAALFVYFRRGLITNILNPKAFIFYITILPRFSGAEASYINVSILTVLYVLIATLIHITIVSAAGAARPWLEDPRRTLVARRVFAVMLALIAVWFAVTTHGKL
jgi:threonine/homoserine/homoserine lactone efflux protein